MTSAISLDQVQAEQLPQKTEAQKITAVDSKKAKFQQVREVELPHEARLFSMPREGGTPKRRLAPTVSSGDEATDLWPGWPCGIGEEIHFSKCFQTCANLTNNMFPVRVEPCKCCTKVWNA